MVLGYWRRKDDKQRSHMPLPLTFYLIENVTALGLRHTQVQVDIFYGDADFKIMFSTVMDVLKRVI